MAEFKQTFSSKTTITFAALPTLTVAAGPSASNEIDNTTTRYDEIILELLIGYNAADVTNAWVDVRILASLDDDGSTWSTWETPYLILPALDASAAGTSTAPTNTIYHTRFVPPRRWKVAVKNNTTQTFDEGTAAFQGVTYTGV